MFIHKRGDTFDLVGPVSLTFDGNPVQDFTGWVPSAQLRNTADDLVAQFVCGRERLCGLMCGGDGSSPSLQIRFSNQFK